jgi:hypothetical protein
MSNRGGQKWKSPTTRATKNLKLPFEWGYVGDVSRDKWCLLLDALLSV